MWFRRSTGTWPVAGWAHGCWEERKEMAETAEENDS
jgi:hypothetical protein